jgi:cytochrome P450
MPYFNAFLKEVLRLYPPTGMVVRKTGREVNIKGFRIPTDTRVVMPMYLIHRHPDCWSNPDSFQPERWLKNEFPASNKNAYMPFASGTRNCVGEHFAMCEAKLILAPLIRSFSFNFAPSCRNVDFDICSFFTIKPKPDLEICVLSRT